MPLLNILICVKYFPGFQCPLNDGSSSRSSSGVYSAEGSSLLSPAQSGKSITDEEVEYLMKASYAPLSYKDSTVTSSVSSGECYAPLICKGTTVTSSVPSRISYAPLSHKDTTDTSSVSSEAVTFTQGPPNVQDSQLDISRYDGFFELLGNLDLEPQSQPLNPEPQTESNSVETGFDVVTTELESWMKDFDFIPTCFDSNSSSNASGGDTRSSDETLKVASPMAGNMQGPLPSQRSVFTPVDASKEHSSVFDTDPNSRSSFIVNNQTPNHVQQYENPCFSTPFENESVNGTISNPHTRFMSPTASAASEDSGYNEEDNKIIVCAEPFTGAENSKVSTKTAFLYSSLKNQNSYSFNKVTTHTSEDNLKDFIQNNLEWPVMSGMHTLTVLPAIVATEESINTLQEPLRLPLTSQSTGSNETCTTGQGMGEQIDLNTEVQTERPQIPSELCQDDKGESRSSEDHENFLMNATCTVSQDEREQVDLSSEVHAIMPQTSRYLQANEHQSLPQGSKESVLTSDVCSDVLDQTDRNDFSTEEQPEVPRTPRSCQDSEQKCIPLENHENVLTNMCSLQDEREQIDLSTEENMSPEHHENLLQEAYASNSSEASHISALSPTPESTVSEGSSHSTSEAKAVSENVGDSMLCSSASSTVPENESRKNMTQETSRCLRVRKPANPSTRKCVSDDDDDTFLDSKIPKVRGKRKNRGVEDIKERAKRKAKSSRLESERRKEGSLNKKSLGKLTKRGNVGKVHPKEQLPTSSGKNYFLENTAERLLGGGHSFDMPGCQTRDGGSNHLGPR